MFIGQLVLKGVVGYGAWSGRGGDQAVFHCDLLAKSTNATLDVAIEHKNEGDPDSAATTVASFTQITSTGVASKPVTSGIEQLWRLKYTVDSSGGENHEEWVIVDGLTPSWRTD